MVVWSVIGDRCKLMFVFIFLTISNYTVIFFFMSPIKPKYNMLLNIFLELIYFGSYKHKI